MKANKKNRSARSRKGFTLVEMLVAMIVMLLATALATLAIDVSSSALTTQTREAEAQTLCSTLCTAICDELRMGKNFAPSAEEGAAADFTYFSLSRKFGADSRIINEESGKIMVKTSEGNFGIVPATAYTHNTKAKCSMQYNEADQTVKGMVVVYIEKGGTEQVLAQSSFTVEPMSR